MGSRHAGFSTWGIWTSLLHVMWDLPWPGVEPVSPALAGRCLTTGPLGKSCFYLLAIAKDTALNLGPQVSFMWLLSVILGLNPGVELLGPVAILCLTFRGTAKQCLHFKIIDRNLIFSEIWRVCAIQSPGCISNFLKTQACPLLKISSMAAFTKSLTELRSHDCP